MSDYRGGISPLGYLIGALVILLIGLLYFFINHGFNFWVDSAKKAMLPTVPMMQEVQNKKSLLADDLPSEAMKRELAEVKQQLAEEVERNKAAREQVEEALRLQAQPKAMPEPTLQRPESKRQVFNLPDGTEVEVPDNGFEGAVKTAMVRHTFKKPMLFDAIQFESGSSKLRESSQDQIKVVAALMNTYKDIKVLIRGHTDSTGAVSTNSLLSLTRSSKMKQQLAGLGINKQRIKIEGVGQSEPLASNETEEGRNKNRRIELVLVE